MEKEYLSIKVAKERYKVSTSTITRFARQNSKTKFVRKEKGKYLISDSLLKANFEKVENKESVGAFTPVSNQSEQKENKEIGSELVNILKTQNEFLQSQIISKDVQLSNKDSQIENLLQRQFEQNTIIQTLQNRFDGIGKQIDTSTLLLSEKVSQKKEVAPVQTNNDNSNFGFTIATAVMIILLVVMIIVFLTVK